MRDIYFFALQLNAEQFIRSITGARHRLRVNAQRFARLARQRMHEYIIGKTGTGKSTHAENELMSRAGGFTFIDPHGQSAERLADALPDIIYVEPFNPECPVSFNVMENVPEPQRHLVVENILSSVKSANPDNWGPNLEDILRNALFLLVDNSASLVQLPRVLSDKSYRIKLLGHSSNKAVSDFWNYEFPRRRNPEDEIRSTQNKVRLFAVDPTLRRFLSHNSLNLARVMNKGQRLVFNLAVSQMGEKPSNLLGSLLINAIYRAALSRNVIPEADRIEHRLVVDEWQNFSTTTFGNILAEARKYKLFLTLLNQLTAQISDEALFRTVLGNAGRLTVFRLAYADAQIMARELGLRAPEILVDLANYRYYRRTGLNLEQEVKADPPSPGRGYLAGNRANTQARYRRPL